MSLFRKHRSPFKLELTNCGQSSAHGGQVLIDAFCRRFGLWRKIADEPLLDPRTRQSTGFAPEAIIAQLLFTLTSGGCSLADAERLGHDAVFLKMVGLDQGADESTLGEYLRGQSKESVRALHRLNRDLVRWTLDQAKPGRVLHGGDLEVFFDDTEIEVYGKKIQAARMNYNGDLALSWQTLWVGPFLLDGILDGAGDVSQHLPALLAEHPSFWQGRASYFYADSGSSAGQYLNVIDRAGFSAWSVSYNKWTGPLDKMAGELAPDQWSAAAVIAGMSQQFTWLKHLPGENEKSRLFAAVRRKRQGDLLWQQGYVVGQPKASAEPRMVFERHALKGAKEQGFSQVLNDLDLHHPPCLDLIANQTFYALGMLAYNILTAFKVLELGEAEQAWQVRTIIRQLLTVPVQVSAHARTVRAHLCLPSGWLRWWRLFVDRWLPQRKAGRPAAAVALESG